MGERDSSRKILAFIPLPPFLCLHPRIQVYSISAEIIHLWAFLLNYSERMKTKAKLSPLLPVFFLQDQLRKGVPSHDLR
jgi:hypothetical protein